MTIRDWLKKPVRMHTYGIQENRPRLYCNDGYSISVQASSFHYCRPREDDSDYTKTVYGYVPIEIIEELINKHGGIKA